MDNNVDADVRAEEGVVDRGDLENGAVRPAEEGDVLFVDREDLEIEDAHQDARPAEEDSDSSLEEFMESLTNPVVRERRERRERERIEQEQQQRQAEQQRIEQVRQQRQAERQRRAQEERARLDALDLDHWDDDTLNRVINEFETVRPSLAGQAVLLIHQLPVIFDIEERLLHTIAYTDEHDYTLLSNHLSRQNGYPLMTFRREQMMTEVYNIPDDDDFARQMLNVVQPETELDIYAFNVFLDIMDVAMNGVRHEEGWTTPKTKKKKQKYQMSMLKGKKERFRIEMQLLLRLD